VSSSAANYTSTMQYRVLYTHASSGTVPRGMRETFRHISGPGAGTFISDVFFGYKCIHVLAG
jgi:hypothetical protein